MNHFIIGLNVAKLHHNIVRKLESATQAVGDGNLSATTARIIAFLGTAEGNHDVFQRDIEQFLGLKPSSVSLILNTMEKNGYITRANVLHDARLKKISVTPKAQELFPVILEAFGTVESSMKDHLTHEELVSLASILAKLDDNF